MVIIIGLLSGTGTPFTSLKLSHACLVSLSAQLSDSCSLIDDNEYLLLKETQYSAGASEFENSCMTLGFFAIFINQNKKVTMIHSDSFEKMLILTKLTGKLFQYIWYGQLLISIYPPLLHLKQINLYNLVTKLSIIFLFIFLLFRGFFVGCGFSSFEVPLPVAFHRLFCTGAFIMTKTHVVI